MKNHTQDLKALGFDIDWTLYFPKNNPQIPNLFCTAIAKELGTSPAEALRFYEENKTQGRSSPQTMKLFCGERLPFSRVYNIFIDIQESNEEIDSTQKDPRLQSFMNRLRLKYTLFTITGNRETHAQRKLKAIGLEGIFNLGIYGTEEKEESLKKIARELKMSHEQMMYIGDSEESDVVPAIRLRMLATRIQNRLSSPSLATFQIRNIYDLQSILF